MNLVLQNTIHSAPHDPMTMLAAASSFEVYLDSRLRGVRGMALLLIDVDHMADINTAIGRQSGDDILREMARRLRVIGGPGNPPARLGGDRFGLVVACDNRDEAEENALSVLRILGAPVTVLGHAVAATVSIGVARGHIASSSRSLMAAASGALMAAKAAGGHVWRVALPQPTLNG